MHQITHVHRKEQQLRTGSERRYTNVSGHGRGHGIDADLPGDEQRQCCSDNGEGPTQGPVRISASYSQRRGKREDGKDAPPCDDEPRADRPPPDPHTDDADYCRDCRYKPTEVM